MPAIAMATVWLIRLLPSPSASSPVLPIAAPWGPPGRPHWLWDSIVKKYFHKIFEKTSRTHGHASILSHNKNLAMWMCPRQIELGSELLKEKTSTDPPHIRNMTVTAVFFTLSVRNLQLP